MVAVRVGLCWPHGPQHTGLGSMGRQAVAALTTSQLAQLQLRKHITKYDGVCGPAAAKERDGEAGAMMVAGHAEIGVPILMPSKHAC